MAFITLSRDNFYHNLNQIALKTGSKEKIAIVLKDNAYGHGLEPMARMASEFGIQHAVVRNYLEAKEIESLFESILILGGEAVPGERFSYAINSLEDIARIPAGTRVELKVDTGMHRNGIAMNDLVPALERIRQKKLHLIGVMTHFRSADVLSSELFWQRKQFERVKKIVAEAGFTQIRIHSHNSAAILRSQDFNEDMVRVGIAAYGYNELPKVFDNIGLKPVLGLYAKRVATHILKEGERVGYGGAFTAPKEMRITTYDLGYGDGWPRGDSDNPYLTAEGLPMLGRVSMDFVTLETDAEEVCIMDHAQKAACHFDTISYEMTTALSPNIERSVI